MFSSINNIVQLSNKSSVRKVVVLIALLSCSFLQPQKAAAQSVSFQVFYDDMSPYGTWVQDPSYGYAWIPNEQGFTPYSSGGHWVLTDVGWTWVSDYAWGWAPFHYGRWHYDNSLGYLWVPGYEWGPAWVSWRRCEGYYGWAPLEPGISVDIAIRDYGAPRERWTFVAERDINRPQIRRYEVSQNNTVNIYQKSTIINNTYVDNSRHQTYVAGPQRTEVQKVTGSNIQPVAIRDNTKPGTEVNSTEMKIYRPNVQQNNSNGAKPAPSKLAKMSDVKPAAQRGGASPNASPVKSSPANMGKNTPPNTGVKSTAPAQQPNNINMQHGAQQKQQPVNANAPKTAPSRMATPQQQAPRTQQPVQQQKPVGMGNAGAPAQRSAPAQSPQQRPNNVNMQRQQAPPQQQARRSAPPQQRMEAPRSAPQPQRMEAPHSAPPQQQHMEAPRSAPQQAPPQQQRMEQPHAMPQQQAPPQQMQPHNAPQPMGRPH